MPHGRQHFACQPLALARKSSTERAVDLDAQQMMLVGVDREVPLHDAGNSAERRRAERVPPHAAAQVGLQVQHLATGVLLDCQLGEPAVEVVRGDHQGSPCATELFFLRSVREKPLVVTHQNERLRPVGLGVDDRNERIDSPCREMGVDRSGEHEWPVAWHFALVLLLDDVSMCWLAEAMPAQEPVALVVGVSFDVACQ